MPPTHTRLASALAAALATSLTLGLTACGGGGSSSDTETSSTTQDASSASYAANSVATTAQAAAALDASVVAAESLVSSPSATLAARNARNSALAVHPLATLTGTFDCAGGGKASVSASAPDPATLYNGRLDEGEVYTLAFDSCRSTSGAPTLSGSLTLTVLAPSGGTRNLQLGADALTATLANGSSVAFNGSLHYASSDAYSDTTHYLRSSTVTSSGVTIVGNRGGRSTTLAVSSLLLTGQSSWNGTTWISSQSSLSCSFSATTPNGSFSATLASTGSASTDANGKPVSGLWSLTLPNALVALTLSNGSGALTIDNGKDGSIDRTIPVTVDALLALI